MTRKRSECEGNEVKKPHPAVLLRVTEAGTYINRRAYPWLIALGAGALGSSKIGTLLDFVRKLTT